MHRSRPGSTLASGIALGLLALSSRGAAQAVPRPANAGNAPVEVLPPAGASGGNGPAAEGPATEKKPARDAAGYAYSDKPTAASSGKHTRYRTSGGPAVAMPGFEPTGDGGSRLFVQLSQSVPVEERKAAGTITYVLKGASPRVWNNTNALVTVHFNTPVSRARLVPQGHDLLFVVELRAAATPTWKMNESADKTATLAIEFPKGDYLAASGEPAPTSGGEPAPTSGGEPPPTSDHTVTNGAPAAAAAAPKPARGRRAGSKPPPAGPKR